MITKLEPGKIDIKRPVNVASKHFARNKLEYYKWLREEAPVHKGKMIVMNVYLLSRYEDCVAMLKDPRFVRNRTTATGGGRFPFPMPKSMRLLADSMITDDDPAHARLRGLVQKAFTPGALSRIEKRIENITEELLDGFENRGAVDLTEIYCLPIPVTVIQEMVGVSDEDMPLFRDGMKVLTNGFSGWSLLRTFAWDLRGVIKFVRGLIEKKRADPQDDILSELIQAEEEGDKLTEDELVSMVILLIFAGHETTVHLIANGVLALLQHPEQLARLRAEPELMGSAVEEILRFNGPIQGTKPNYPTEDVTVQGVTIPKGAMVMPILGAGNHDPAVFENPEVFDIARKPNKHLGFGVGEHFCLGAPLARMEARIALTNLIERHPDMRLAVEPEELEIQTIPLWHRYKSMPVVLG